MEGVGLYNARTFRTDSLADVNLFNLSFTKSENEYRENRMAKCDYEIKT